MTPERRSVIGAAISRAVFAAFVAGAGACGGAASAAGSDASALAMTCGVKIAEGDSATPYSATDFCALYASVCGAQSFMGMLTPSTCVATYESWVTMTIDGTDGVQSCVSSHLCNARAGSPEMHCYHATAQGPCMPTP